MADQSIQTALKKRILNNQQLIGHETERNQIVDLVQRTALQGESNSVLIIGPKGAGKTLLINSVINEISTKSCFHSDCLIVKLHGLIHTDDRLALKSITNQMQLDNAVDGKVFGSFAENLAFLLACLRTGEKQSSKSVIFILDEFDLFCAHHNQTLLYNLFDISQSAQAPICVIGITCRTDVIQLLEKRVKSRFSHRQIFIYPENDERTDLEHIKFYLNIQNNIELNKLMKDKRFLKAIERFSDLDLNENNLKNLLIKCLSSNRVTGQKFEQELNNFEQDDIVLLMQDLTTLELCLVIAMQHHREIYEENPMNFEMVYNRYLKFANKHSTMQNVQRAVVMKAFEHLEKLELVLMVQQSKNVQKEYQFFKLLATSMQITEAIRKYPGLPTEIVQWANSSLN